MALRQRGQKPSETSGEENPFSSYSASPSPGYNTMVRRSASAGSGVVNRLSPPPPPPPSQSQSPSLSGFPRSISSPGGDGILPSTYVSPWREDHRDNRSPSTGRATIDVGTSCVPPPVVPRPGGGRRILWLAHFVALTAATCLALHSRFVMTDVGLELDAAREGRRKALADERDGATAAERARLEAEVGELKSRIDESERSHSESLLELERLGGELGSLGARRLSLERDVAHAENLVEDARGEREKYAAMVEGVDGVGEYMKTREATLWKRIEGLEKRIQRESHREAMEWFGPGPHRVELEVEYPHAPQDPLGNPDPATWKRWKSYLLMEMAPLDLMPHTVNLFLKQVHGGLWDGAHVSTNARHVMQIGPMYDDNLATNVTKGVETSYHHFRDVGLDKVSYQEYSPEFPHDQYTIGMAGRPSGPDFYVNKVNNTIMHGPGGQMNDGDMHNEADPCFGKLVDGGRKFTEILAAIDLVPLHSEQYRKTKVWIKSAKILIRKEDGKWRALGAGKKWNERDKIMPLPQVPHGV